MKNRTTLGLAAFAAALAGVLPVDAQPYSNAVIALKPVAYLPLAETVATPFGYYIATNLGTAGPAANGFYQTWYHPNGTAFYPTNYILHVPGPTGDGDTAMLCSNANISAKPYPGPGQYVVIPRTTNGVPNPAVTISAPFSIELWINSANTNLGLQPIVTEGRNPVAFDPNVGYTNTYLGFSLGQFKNFFYFQVYNAVRNQNSGYPEIDTAPLQPNTWYHVVATYDGANIAFFVNGAAGPTKAGPGPNYLGHNYEADPTSPLLIGTGTDLPAVNGGNNYSGSLDDVAIYPTALSLSQIQAHFAAASGGTYAATVLGDSPTIYLRLDEPPLTTYPDPGTYPVANNYGLLGSLANGVYQLGTTPGVAGPSYTGFGPESRAVAFNGFFGNVDVGGGNLPVELNPTGSQSFTVATWFRGNPADAPARFQVLVGHTDRSWRLTLDGGSATSPAGNRFNPGNGPELSFANTADVVTNGFRCNDGNWHFVAGVSDGSHDFLYIDGLLAKTNSATVGAIVGTNLDFFIGGDPQYTVPSTNSASIRSFNGQLAHVAFFTNALSAADIATLYGAAGVPPSIVLQPRSLTGNAGSTVALNVNVHGSQPLAYQWYFGNSAVDNGTNAVLSFNPLAPGNAGAYYVVATNATGSVTSAVVQVTVYSTPVIVQQSPAAVQVFAGSSPTLHVSVLGPSLAYQWTRNSSPISGATSSSYTDTNVQANATFGCTITNVYGTAAITPIAVTVLAAPTVNYPATVIADKPVSYFRLNETSGTTAYDYVGGLNATYTNAVLGQPGYSANDPTELSAQFGSAAPTNSFAGYVPTYLDFGAPTGATSAFSVEAWVNGGFAPQLSDAGLVTLGFGNGGEQFNLDCGGRDPAHDYRFFVRDAGGATHGVNATNAPTDGLWHHVVGVCDQPKGAVYLYVDGILQGSAAIGTNSGILALTTPLSIGSRQSGFGSQYDNQFAGSIDDVSLYGYALTSTQVLAHYFASGVAPLITLNPTNTTASEGANAFFYAGAFGTPPLALQWYEVSTGTPLSLANQTNSSLVISNVTVADNNRDFVLTVTNLFGQATSRDALLTVIAGPPFLITDIQPLFAMGYAGTPFTYSIEVGGSAPFTYIWTRNGTTISGATGSSYSFDSLVGTNLYAVTVQNSGGSLSSSTATNIGFAVPTLNPADYTYKMKITFAGYNRPEALRDFPALVQIGTNLPGFAYSQFASPSGGDLRFTDAGGTRELPHEIDEWNPGGVSGVWVQLPSLASNTNFIWAYWGNPAATMPEAWSTNGEVWVPAFGAAPPYNIVYHLKEGAFPFADSTTLHPATNGVAPAAAPGIVGTGGLFNAGPWLDAGTNDLGDQMTFSAWLNIPTGTSDIQTIWANQAGGFGMPGFALFVNSYQATDQILDFATGIGNNTGSEARTASGTVSFGQWHLITVAVDRLAGSGQVYLDGAPVSLASGSFYPGFTNVADLRLGQFAGGAFPMHGTMDEARVASSIKSANWIWADYMTVAQNSTFENYSAIQSSAVTLNFTVSGPHLILSWAQGTLQSAPVVTGTYTNITTATSPYTNILSGQQQYFRVKVR